MISSNETPKNLAGHSIKVLSSMLAALRIVDKHFSHVTVEMTFFVIVYIFLRPTLHLKENGPIP